MPDAQITDRLSPRHTVRPRCPQCQARMEVQHVALGRLGFEHWTLSNINFDDAALIAGEHYTVCIQRSKMSAGQLTRNVIEFAKDKPPLHTGNVQSAGIQYLIAACGAPPVPK